MSKCADILKKEEKIVGPIAVRSLWNLYAINYFDRDLIDKLSESISANQSVLTEKEVVAAFKSYAYLGYMPVDATSALVSRAIKNADTYEYASLADILESMVLINKK